jgi:hypothetical protein
MGYPTVAIRSKGSGQVPAGREPTTLRHVDLGVM